MSHDIFQPVPQGSLGAQDEENRRVGAIADELRRLCQLYEAQPGDSQQDVNQFEAEQRAAEVYAKEHGLWLPMAKVFDLGVPGPSGNENDTYVADDSVYKVNNLLNCGSILQLLGKVMMHNVIFPETYYRLHAFTGFDGRTVMPVLRQICLCFDRGELPIRSQLPKSPLTHTWLPLVSIGRSRQPKPTFPTVSRSSLLSKAAKPSGTGWAIT